MVRGRRTRKRPLAALCPLLLLFLPPAQGAMGSLLDVVVNLRAADGVDPALLPPAALELSTIDNSDLFVAMCAPGTFSPDDRGVCHECQGCHTEQFETLPCLPYRDRGCANCTVCAEHEVEICQCSVKTSQCFTGDRVCLKMKPTTVTLTVEMRSNAPLSSRQQQLVAAGLATGFIDWLVEEFGTPSVEFVSLVGVGPSQYAATFTFTELYNQTTVLRLKTPDPALYQRGLVYTFGNSVRRRRLLAYTGGLVSATGSHSDCLTNTTCEGPYLVFQFFNESGCGGTCVGAPCPPGLFGGFGHCTDCAPGSYTDAPGSSACTPCPYGWSSPPAANSSQLCFEVVATAVLEVTTTVAATTPLSAVTSRPTTTQTAAPPVATAIASTALPIGSTTAVIVPPVTTTAVIVPPVTTTAVIVPPVTTTAVIVPPVTTAAVVAPPVTTAAVVAPPSGGSAGGSNYNHNANENSNANTNTNTNFFRVEIPPAAEATKGSVYSNVINVMVPPPGPDFHDQYGFGHPLAHPFTLLLLLLLVLCCFHLGALGCCLSPVAEDYSDDRRERPVIRYRILRPARWDRDPDGV